MKTTIRVICVVLLGLFASQSPLIAGNDKPITASELPTKIQQMINDYFKGKNVAVILVNRYMRGKSYDVVLTSGEKLEFDRNGDWTEFDCKYSSVPTALIPSAIMTYIDANYSGATIMQIEKDRSKYEVKLSTGIEITFDKKFQVIDIDT